MPFYSPAGGAFYYIVWASGYNSAGAAYIVYEFPNAVVPGQVLTISLAGNTNLSGVTYSLGARNSSHSDLGFSSAVAVQLTRNSVSYTMPTGAAYATLVIQINAQNSAGAYRELYFRDIKLELGSVATVFTDDYGAGNVRARVTETEEAIADEVSARAAFQTTAEADIGSLESSVTTQGSAIADIEGNLSASYALTLDVNGRVTGVRFLNDGTTGSIKFLADYFSIYNGSSDVPMFEVTGGAAYIAGSRVRTESMTSNAVSQGVVEENDTAQSVDENWTALADVSVTVPSSATLVKLDWSFFIAESGEAEDDLLVRIKRDSTVIYETTAARVPPTFDFETTETGPLSWQGYAVGQFSGFDTDAPSAGTYTYTLEAKCAYSTTTAWSLEKRRLFALLFKR